MKRLCSALALLSLAGCATYDDPYYSDRYYERTPYEYRHNPNDRHYYAYQRYRDRYPSWYYDLYDPYSALFVPLAYLYDPWYWDDYRFGIHRYPGRYWSFAFYDGRPWFYSPWYGGYGIYRPYFHSVPAPPVRYLGVPSVLGSGGESAQSAARGMAAEIHGGGSALADYGLIRSSEVRVSASMTQGATLLGTMATPVQTHGLPAGGVVYREGAANYSDSGVAASTRSTRIFEREFAPARQGLPGGEHGIVRDASNSGLPMERAGFRQLNGLPAGGWREESSFPAQELQAERSVPLQRYERSAGDGVGYERPYASPDHPWRDSTPSETRYSTQSVRGAVERSEYGSGLPGGAPAAGWNSPRIERSERSFDAPVPRMESRSMGGGRGGSINGLSTGDSEDSPQQ